MDLFNIDSGEEIPLLLLHGFPFDHTIWNKMIRHMEKGIRIIAPDLRGHGCSKISSNKYLISDIAVDIVELLDRLQINKVMVAGHSFGGYVALDLYRNFPDRLAGLALISSHVYPDSVEKKKSRFESIDKINKLGAAGALANMPNLLTLDPKVKHLCSKLIAKMDSLGAAGAQFAMAHRESSEELWKSMTIRQLVIAGSDDQLIPIETSRKISDLSRNSSFIVIENAGHMPMLEAPNLVAEALEKFILN
ncbi:MAG: alpha/beta hydrolase [Pelolinea sp.]|nr:alpha/beta hydrolase [Pelolinea sp.]